jgi:hypothetical protein
VLENGNLNMCEVSLVTQENLHHSRVRYVVLSCALSVVYKYIRISVQNVYIRF